MPLVGGRGVLALEHVPEMASALGAHDFDPLHAEASVHLDAYDKQPLFCVVKIVVRACMYCAYFIFDLFERTLQSDVPA